MPKIKAGSTVILHAGSANFMEGEIKNQTCDVLFMCVPGWERVPKYTTTMLEQLSPQTIVPFHFDDFTRPLSPGGKTPLLPFLKMPQFLRAVATAAPQADIRLPFPWQEMQF